MAKTQKRPSSATISKSAIAAASSALEALPAKPKSNWSLRETVSMLQESIVEALSKGYSYPEVAKMLSTKGVDISASSLKSYLSAAKRGTAKKKTGTRKATKASNVVELKPKTAAKTKIAAKKPSQPKLTVVASKSTKTAAKAKSSASARATAPKAKAGRKKLG
jgi:hypothetical protein